LFSADVASGLTSMIRSGGKRPTGIAAIPGQMREIRPTLPPEFGLLNHVYVARRRSS
jgi:hypothetical protein